MIRRLLMQTAVVVICISLSACAGTTKAVMDQPGPLPEKIESEDFRGVLARSGDAFIAGQPTEAGLEWVQRQGVTTVVSVRTAAEMDNRDVVPFDEAAAVEALGMRYVHIPLGGDDDPYDEAAVAEFAEVMESADGHVLLHCTVAWRASHVWAAWLVKHRGMSLNEAVRQAEAINFGTLPIEGLLGDDLELGYGDQRQDR